MRQVREVTAETMIRVEFAPHQPTTSPVATRSKKPDSMGPVQVAVMFPVDVKVSNSKQSVSEHIVPIAPEEYREALEALRQYGRRESMRRPGR